jgi:hypothetical protein
MTARRREDYLDSARRSSPSKVETPSFSARRRTASFPSRSAQRDVLRRAGRTDSCSIKLTGRSRSGAAGRDVTVHVRAATQLKARQDLGTASPPPRGEAPAPYGRSFMHTVSALRPSLASRSRTNDTHSCLGFAAEPFGSKRSRRALLPRLEPSPWHLRCSALSRRVCSAPRPTFNY